MKTIFRSIHDFFSPPPKPQRLELRCVTWAEGDRLIRSNQKWQLAIPEEDHNLVIGMVYLERVDHTQHCLKRQKWGDGECECNMNK